MPVEEFVEIYRKGLLMHSMVGQCMKNESIHAWCFVGSHSGFLKGNQLVVAFGTEDILKMNGNILNEVVVVGHHVVLKDLFPLFELLAIANEKLFKLLAPCCVGQRWSGIGFVFQSPLFVGAH